MSYSKNKLKLKVIVFLLITTLIFWLIPSNLIFGGGDTDTLESLQQAVEEANAALESAQKAADEANTTLAAAQTVADEANAALANAGEGADLEAFQKAADEANAALKAAEETANKANEELKVAQAAVDGAKAALEAYLAAIAEEGQEGEEALDITVSYDAATYTDLGAKIWTDKEDYSPGETVTIYGSGFSADANVAVSVTRPDNHVDTWSDVLSDGSGGFITTYQLNGIEGLYTVVATDGTNTPMTTFTDKVVSINITVSPTSVAGGSTTSFTVTVSVPMPASSYHDVGSITISMGTVSGSSWGTPSSVSITDITGWTVDSTGAGLLKINATGNNLDPGETMNITFSVQAPSPSATGSSTWSVTGFNNRNFSGSTDTKTQNVQVTAVETTPPETWITAGPTGWINVQSPTFSWTGSDDVTATANLVYSWKLDGGAWSAYSSATSTTLAGLAEGSHTFYVRAKDAAGNEDSTPASQSFGVDITAPVITAGTPTGTLGSNGWWVSSVTVPFSATDNLSGFAPGGLLSKDLASETTVGEGAALDVTSDGISDMAGNSAVGIQAGPFKVDWTPPVVTITLLDTGNGEGKYILNQIVSATWNANDSLSGVDGDTSGTITLDTSTIGPKTVTVPPPTVKDYAGNEAAEVSASYSVIYQWYGFLPPINTSGARSVFKLGSTVPVKFRIGPGIIPDATATIGYALVTGDTAGPVNEAVSTSAATSGNLFRYDSTDNLYIFNLNTKKITDGAGTYRISVALDDGMTYNVDIGLK